MASLCFLPIVYLTTIDGTTNLFQPSFGGLVFVWFAPCPPEPWGNAKLAAEIEAMGLSLGAVTAKVCEPLKSRSPFPLAYVPLAPAMIHRRRVYLSSSAVFLWGTAATVLFSLPVPLQPTSGLGRQAAAWSAPAPGNLNQGGRANPATEGVLRAEARLPEPAHTPIAGLSRDLPWWPWILAFPVLGGLLWWLLRRATLVPPGSVSEALSLETGIALPTEEGAGGGLGAGATGTGAENAAVADPTQDATKDADQASDLASTLAPDPGNPVRRIILTPRSGHAAYAYWELPPSEVEALQRRNYGLTLKVHDVTDLDPAAGQTPHRTERVTCPTTAMGDCHLAIPQADRDYLVELGYEDDPLTWHALVRSESVRVPAQPHREEPQPAARPTIAMPPPEIPAPETPPRSIAGLSPSLGAEDIRKRVADAAIPHPGTTAATAALSAQTCRSACARWEIPLDQVTDLKTGKRRLTVRLYDVTEMPGFLASNPNSVQEFEAELAPQAERVLPIAVDDRDYLIEVGYVTGSGQWHVLAKSSPVRVPAC